MQAWSPFPPPEIPESEIQIAFARSSGPGGQNVNKRSTKVEARWNVDRSSVLSDTSKERVRTVLANRINREGELIVESERGRFQSHNRSQAIAILRKLVIDVLTPRPPRVPTRPSRSSIERRLSNKTRKSIKKTARRHTDNENES